MLLYLKRPEIARNQALVVVPAKNAKQGTFHVVWLIKLVSHRRLPIVNDIGFKKATYFLCNIVTVLKLNITIGV